VEEEEIYSVTEAARIRSVTDRAVRKWLAEGTLEGAKDKGGRSRILQSAVHACLDDRPPREARGSDLSVAEMVEVPGPGAISPATQGEGRGPRRGQDTRGGTGNRHI